MNNQITSLSNEIQQLMQNQSLQNMPELAQLNQNIASVNKLNSVDQQRESIAKLEASLQQAITNIESGGNEQVLEKLNQLQTELMNYSQSLEHQLLNQMKTENIPGEPLGTDNDPAPGQLLT